MGDIDTLRSACHNSSVSVGKDGEGYKCNVCGHPCEVAEAASEGSADTTNESGDQTVAPVEPGESGEAPAETPGEEAAPETTPEVAPGDAPAVEGGEGEATPGADSAGGEDTSGTDGADTAPAGEGEASFEGGEQGAADGA